MLEMKKWGCVTVLILVSLVCYSLFKLSVSQVKCCVVALMIPLLYQLWLIDQLKLIYHVQYSTVQCSAVQYSAVLCSAPQMLCSSNGQPALFSSIPLCPFLPIFLISYILHPPMCSFRPHLLEIIHVFRWECGRDDITRPSIIFFALLYTDVNHALSAHGPYK